MPSNVERRKLTPPQVAKQWGCSTNKVLRFIRTGQLKAIDLTAKRGNRPRYAIDLADIAAFEASRLIVPDGAESTTRRLRRRTPPDIKQFF
jgi:hypothetical protein